jgi:hypothetical protein
MVFQAGYVGRPFCKAVRIYVTNTTSLQCGTGAAYCGPDVCIDTCDQFGECGLGAKNVGANCPLNVCCNEFNKCGTTKEFCNDKCQSNCTYTPSSNRKPKNNVD